MPVLEALHVTKVHATASGSVCALPELSFTADRGELVVIAGPSGAGKSTLMNVLSSLDRPSAGQVLFHGWDLFDAKVYDVAEVRNSRFGFIFQTPYLLTDRTVLENVGLPFLYGTPLPVAEARAKCLELLAYVGLTDLADRYPQSLSGGEMQRVVFARAMVRGPEVIFADEPTGSLDAENSERILDLLKDQAEKGCTVIMVTHDQRAINYGDRVVTLQKISAGAKA